MKIIHKGTYFLIFENLNGKKIEHLSFEEARRLAEDHVGNDVFTKIPGENTYLYGPGDGTTSVFMREEIEFDMEG